MAARTNWISEQVLVLMCENGHDHHVGKRYQHHLADQPCPWCGKPMRKAMWKEGAELRRSEQYMAAQIQGQASGPPVGPLWWRY